MLKQARQDFSKKQTFFFNADVFTGILPSNKFEKEITWMRAGVHFQVP